VDVERCPPTPPDFLGQHAYRSKHRTFAARAPAVTLNDFDSMPVDVGLYFMLKGRFDTPSDKL
jgi:hypothetical protein